MPALWVMGGAAILGALSSAEESKTSAKLNMHQYNFQEHQRLSQWADQSWFQVLNNAERWARNKAIAKDALSVREKSKFWDRVRHENTTSQMSKGMYQAYSNLNAELTGRMGPNSATSRAMLRNSMQNYHEARKTINVNEALRSRGREEAYQRTLATRDFGFTPISEHWQGFYAGADPNTAYNTALISGLASGAVSVTGAYYAQNPYGGGEPGDGEPGGGGGQGGNRGGYGRMGPYPD